MKYSASKISPPATSKNNQLIFVVVTCCAFKKLAGNQSSRQKSSWLKLNSLSLSACIRAIKLEAPLNKVRILSLCNKYTYNAASFHSVKEIICIVFSFSLQLLKAKKQPVTKVNKLLTDWLSAFCPSKGETFLFSVISFPAKFWSSQIRWTELVTSIPRDPVQRQVFTRAAFLSPHSPLSYKSYWYNVSCRGPEGRKDGRTRLIISFQKGIIINVIIYKYYNNIFAETG